MHFSSFFFRLCSVAQPFVVLCCFSVVFHDFSCSGGVRYWNVRNFLLNAKQCTSFISFVRELININIDIVYFKSKQEWLPNLPSQRLVLKSPTRGIRVESRQGQKGKTVGVSSQDEKPSCHCRLWELSLGIVGLELHSGFRSTVLHSTSPSVSCLLYLMNPLASALGLGWAFGRTGKLTKRRYQRRLDPCKDSAQNSPFGCP